MNAQNPFQDLLLQSSSATAITRHTTLTIGVDEKGMLRWDGTLATLRQGDTFQLTVENTTSSLVHLEISFASGQASRLTVPGQTTMISESVQCDILGGYVVRVETSHPDYDMKRKDTTDTRLPTMTYLSFMVIVVDESGREIGLSGTYLYEQGTCRLVSGHLY